MINAQTKAFAKQKEDILISKLSSSREYGGSMSRQRDDSQRDYARILYSSSFRRLQGKMQLFEVDAEKFNRNRLTHSLEVAQIARNIASDLDLKNVVVAELAALAHDIGNPPFGHSGEKVLDKLAKKVGGYEGNAQALRILRKLEKKFPDCDGLDLTYRSLLSIIKYPYGEPNSKGKFLYDEDYDFYQKVLSENGIHMEEGEKTIDAQIMDLADEIAYAAHDLEDALSRDVVNIEDIEYEFSISETFKPALCYYRDLVNESKEAAFRTNPPRSSEEFSIVFKKELISNIVNLLCNDICVVKNEIGYEELGFHQYGLISKGLKKLLIDVIMRKRNILTYEFKGNNILKDLFHFYCNGNNVNFLSPELRLALPESKADEYESKKIRAVIDYISGMMDAFAIKEWETHCKCTR